MNTQLKMTLVCACAFFGFVIYTFVTKRPPCVTQTTVKDVTCWQYNCTAMLENGIVIKTYDDLLVKGQPIGLDARGNHVCK